jgi:predicted RNase H-like nuclease (RuvC/YqgF family)
LIANSKNTQEKKNTMQNLKNTMFPKDQNIERLQGTIDQKNRIIEELQTAISRRNKTIQDLKNIATLNNQRSLEQRSNDTNVTLRKDEIRTLENQLAHRDHVVRTLEFAYENLEKSSEERITALWDEIKNKDEKIVELQNARGRYLEDRKYQTTSDNEGRKIKKEKKPKIKPEPMEY